MADNRWSPAEPGDGQAFLLIRREFTFAKEISQLKRLLAEKVQEVDFFKGALQKVEARRRSKRKHWREGIYDQIREVMSMQGNLSVERMCVFGGGQPGRLLSVVPPARTRLGGNGTAIGHSSNRDRAQASLRLPTA